MKKKVISVTLAAMMTLGAVPAFADIADENEVWHANLNTETGELTVITDNTTPAPVYTALPNNAIRVVVDNKELSATGVSIDGRTLIPLRALGEALGAKVDWNAAKQEIRIEKMLYQADSRGITSESNRIIIMNVGSKQILKNGTGQDIDVAPQIINGSTMVPVRAVTDFLEATVNWDDASRTVTVQASMATTAEGALKEQQNQQIDFGNAVANRVEELDRQAKIEQAKAKEEAKAKGELWAWGYSVEDIYVNDFGVPHMEGLNIDLNGVGDDRVTFKLQVVDKNNGDIAYEKNFIYQELTKSDAYRILDIPRQYWDDDKYEYKISVAVD